MIRNEEIEEGNGETEIFYILYWYWHGLWGRISITLSIHTTASPLCNPDLSEKCPACHSRARTILSETFLIFIDSSRVHLLIDSMSS